MCKYLVKIPDTEVILKVTKIDDVLNLMEILFANNYECVEIKADIETIDKYMNTKIRKEK